MPQQIPTLSPREAMVEGDISCASCGYNLRTLSIAGICPECAAPVAASLKKGPFDDAPRRWIVIVAGGLGLLIAAFGLAILGDVLWVARDREVVLIETGPAGPKLWIMTRMLQMGVPTAANLFNCASLMVHVLGVTALGWPVRRETVARRWMRRIVVAMAATGLIYWVMIALHWWPVGSIGNDIKSPALAVVTMLDISCVVVTNLLIAGIAYRSGHKRIARAVQVLMVVQGAGLLLLFSGIYFFNRVEPLIWPSLLLHAAGGGALTIISIWLMFKLAGAAWRVRSAAGEG